MIGKENIEEKIFEYFEGDLSLSEAKDLEDFIQANQEYQEDFDAWKNSSVKSEPYQFKHMEDLLVNESHGSLAWFKWASSGVFIVLLSFVSFGIFQKINSRNVSEISSVIADKREQVLDTKLVSGNLLNNHNLVSRIKSKDGFSNGDDNSANNNSIINNDINESILKSHYNINTIVKDYNTIKNGHFRKQTNKKNSIILNDDLTTFFTVEIDDKNGILENLISKIESLKKPEFEYEDPNKKREYPILLNLQNPYLHYNLAHTLEENGSFAGSTDGIRGEFLYRTEWPSVTSESYESQIGSVDWRSESLKGGIGFIVNRDMIGHGKLSSLSASLIYAPKFVLKGISLIPSFKYTFNNKTINWDQVKSNDIKDPRNGVLYASIPLLPEGVSVSDFIYHDFGFGMLVNANKFYAGFQYDHVNNPSYKEDFFDQKITIPGKYSIQLGTDIKQGRDSKFVFSPSLNFVSYGNYNALWTNAQFSYNGFMLVGGGATNSDFMFSLGYTNAKVRLVYGLGFSKPSAFSGLEPGNYYESHQLSLRVNLKPKKR